MRKRGIKKSKGLLQIFQPDWESGGTSKRETDVWVIITARKIIDYTSVSRRVIHGLRPSVAHFNLLEKNNC